MMNKKILTSVLLVALASSLIGTATIAGFTSQASNINNTVATGKIYLSADRDDTDPAPGPLFYFDNETDGAAQDGYSTPGTKEDGYWYPGKQSGIKVLDVYNGSTLQPSIPIKLIGLDAVVEDPTPENGVDDTILKNAIYIKVWGPLDPVGVYRWQGYLSDLTNGNVHQFATPFAMSRIHKQTLNFQASMPTDPPGDDNDYQGKNIKVQFRVYATQN